jgi:hypothetical protein
MDIIQDDSDFAIAIVKRLEENMGIKLLHIFEESDDTRIIRKNVRSSIRQWVIENIDNNQHDSGWNEVFYSKEIDLYFKNSDINPIPPIAVTEKNLAVIRQYSGSQIHDYIKGVVNGLSLLKDGQTPGQMAGIILGSGVTSFAVAMIGGTAKALYQGKKLLDAVKYGVSKMGSPVLIAGVAAVIVTELLLYLASVQKTFLGIVFNNTELNLIVHGWRENKYDVYINKGSMAGFMETHENEDLNSPMVQIPAKRADSNNESESLVLGGIFVAQKNFGFYGTDGAMAFSAPSKTNARFFLMFACPYSRDNGVNVLVDAGAPQGPKKIFRSLFDNRGIDKSSAAGGYKFVARCSDKRGAEAAGIAVLDSI